MRAQHLATTGQDIMFYSADQLFALAIGQLQMEALVEKEIDDARKKFRGKVLNVAISNAEYAKQREANVADTPFGFS